MLIWAFSILLALSLFTFSNSFSSAFRTSYSVPFKLSSAYPPSSSSPFEKSSLLISSTSLLHRTPIYKPISFSSPKPSFQLSALPKLKAATTSIYGNVGCPPSSSLSLINPAEFVVSRIVPAFAISAVIGYIVFAIKGTLERRQEELIRRYGRNMVAFEGDLKSKDTALMNEARCLFVYLFTLQCLTNGALNFCASY